MLAVVAGAAAAPASSQTVTAGVLPAHERLKPQQPLSATLHLSSDRITVDEPLHFTLRLRNTGKQRLSVSPHVASNLRIFDAAGRHVEAQFGAIVDYIGSQIAPEALIRLEPAQAHEFEVTAEYHSSPDFSGVHMYYALRPDRSRDPAVLRLLPGRYSARFTYLNYPDYGPWQYDVAQMPADIWEGRVETPAVPFTVLPLDDARVSQLLAEIAGAGPAPRAIELVGWGRVSAATDVLLNRFQRSIVERASIVVAVHALGGDAVPRVLTLIQALPERERDEVVMTRAFAMLARDARQCAGVPLLLQALYSTRGDVVSILGDAIASLAPACPSVIAELRALLQAADNPPETDYGRTAYRRGHAAELLGRLGNTDDVPLLIAVLRRAVPGAPPSSPKYGDRAREGAVRALARLGGAEAATALVEQLDDEIGNRFILRELVEAAAKLRPPGLNKALARLLTSTNLSATDLVGILNQVMQLRDDSLVPYLRPLLKHPDRRLRSYATSALAAMETGSVRVDMLAAAEDADPQVQSTALFHLAKHGDASLLPLFLNRLVSEHQYVRQAASEGVARFGTAETFGPLRTALDTAGDQARPYVARTLQFLTFVTLDSRKPAEWDAWWSAYRHGTRLDWARAALDGPSGPRERSYVMGGSPMLAARYLAALPGPSVDLVERATEHRDWQVRITAAEIAGRTDQRRAMALLIAELENRHLGACRAAARQLTTLTGISDDVDCTDPVARQQAVSRWARR